MTFSSLKLYIGCLSFVVENGSLIWSPTSSSPVFATLRANNSVAITELELTLILCNCSNNGTCNYDNPVLKSQRNNSKFMTATCGCLDAWTGEFCTDNLNACFENSCYNTSSCVDNPAPLQGYICSPCPKGLIGDGIKCFGEYLPNLLSKLCIQNTNDLSLILLKQIFYIVLIDIDECFENTSDCDQICINSFTGYNCSCNEGFTINSQNASQCKDIDECVSLLNPCGEDAVCTNKPGNYSCSCRDGYRGDPYLLCTDINECMNSSLNVCSNTSVCFNTNGSYHCECLSGFTGPNCTDIMPSTTIAIATTGINATTAQTTSEPINSYTTSSSSPLLITTTLEIMTSTSASNSENTSVLHTSTPAKSPGNFSSSTSSFVTTTVTASSQADHPKTEAPITPTSVQSSGGTSAHSSTVATIEIILSSIVPMATTETTVAAAQTTSEPTNSNTTSSLSPSSITTTLEMKTNTSASTSENTSVLHTSTLTNTSALKSTVMENFTSRTSSSVTTTVTVSSSLVTTTVAPITSTSIHSSGVTLALSSTVATTGALQTTTSSSTCMIVSCPSGFCSNGGTCSINVTTCTPSCMCPPMFTDDRCILAGNSFAPEPSRGMSGYKTFLAIAGTKGRYNIQIKKSHQT
uniref:EGF-like domain-containing protein n=1 Tax=Xenopus tropicalis TaxID=8364 RepID=A0A6I8QI65_XENTR